MWLLFLVVLLRLVLVSAVIDDETASPSGDGCGSARRGICDGSLVQGVAAVLEYWSAAYGSRNSKPGQQAAMKHRYTPHVGDVSEDSGIPSTRVKGDVV
jgi:hypothetical protein